MGAALLLVAAAGVAHLPPGVCFDDAGDLQTASAMLGIAHPPGYMGYVTVGWLLCRALFFIEPAYVVSLACLACMVLAIGVCIALLVRLGLHVLIACAVGLALVAHDAVWKNMVFPEVYAPSLALLAVVAYLFLKYGRLHRARDAYLAAALFGFLLIDRPPAAFFIPGLAAGWLVVERRFGLTWREMLRRAGAVSICCAAPMVAVLAVLWWRDSPETAYHITQRHAEIFGGLPEYDGTPAAHFARVTWIVTGSQFAHLMGAGWNQVCGKVRWIRRQLGVYETPRWIALLVVLAVGVRGLMRRAAEWALLAAGIVIGNIVFLTQYRVYGQAANLLPTLFGAALIAGGVLSYSFPAQLSRARSVVASLLFVGLCAWTAYDSAVRPNYADGADASRFLAGVDMRTLPRDSVICTRFSEACPLWYAKLVACRRPDVRVAAGPITMWPKLAEAYLDRPVFYLNRRAQAPPGWRLLPWRNLLRLARGGADAGPSSVSAQRTGSGISRAHGPAASRAVRGGAHGAGRADVVAHSSRTRSSPMVPGTARASNDCGGG